MAAVTDEFTEYVAAKLTHNQKRGYGPAKASTREMHNDRRVIEPPKERSVEELRSAQLFLATLAMDKPDDQREAWLADVLDVLGLRDISVRRRDEEQACWPYEGSRRGYNQHLRTYTRPCKACADEHQKTLDARLREMGISTEGESKWTFQLS